MARKKRSIPEINAGSMADIAFLLLIFFLVTATIETDTGIPVKLPPMEKNTNEIPIKKRNILEILVNANNQLLVEGKVLQITQLKDVTKRFVTNNGKDPNMSENPKSAVVSLKNDRGTNYEVYVSVWNELAAAYNEIKDEYAQREYGRSYEKLEDAVKKEIDNKYPKLVSEAEPESYGGD